MAKNNKTRFFYDLYSDKTWVFDQSERAYYPIYIIILDNAGSTEGQVPQKDVRDNCIQCLCSPNA